MGGITPDWYFDSGRQEELSYPWENLGFEDIHFRDLGASGQLEANGPLHQAPFNAAPSSAHSAAPPFGHASDVGSARSSAAEAAAAAAAVDRFGYISAPSPTDRAYVIRVLDARSRLAAAVRIINPAGSTRQGIPASAVSEQRSIARVDTVSDTRTFIPVASPKCFAAFYDKFFSLEKSREYLKLLLRSGWLGQRSHRFIGRWGTFYIHRDYVEETQIFSNLCETINALKTTYEKEELVDGFLTFVKLYHIIIHFESLRLRITDEIFASIHRRFSEERGKGIFIGQFRPFDSEHSLTTKQASVIWESFFAFKEKEIAAFKKECEQLGSYPEIEVSEAPCVFIQRVLFPQHMHFMGFVALRNRYGIYSIGAKNNNKTVLAVLDQLGVAALGKDYDAASDISNVPVQILKPKVLDFFKEISIVWKKQNIQVVPLIMTIDAVHHEKPSHGGQRDSSDVLFRSIPVPRGHKASKGAVNEALLHLLEPGKKKTIKRRKNAAADAAQKTLTIPRAPQLVLSDDLPEWLKELTGMQGELLCQLVGEVVQEERVKILRDGFVNGSESVTLPDIPQFYEKNSLQNHETIFLSSLLREDQKQLIARYDEWNAVGINGIFAAEPGLGKTRTASELLLRSLIKDPLKPCFVVAPSLVKDQWKTEFYSVVPIAAIQIASRLIHSSLPNPKKNQLEDFRLKLLKRYPETFAKMAGLETMDKKNFKRCWEILRDKFKKPGNDSNLFLQFNLQLGHLDEADLLEKKQFVTKFCSISICSSYHIAALFEAFKPDLGQPTPSDEKMYDQLYHLFENFSEDRELVQVMNDLKDFRDLLDKGPTLGQKYPGIIVVQPSYFWNSGTLKPILQEMKPGFVILDEAHMTVGTPPMQMQRNAPVESKQRFAEMKSLLQAWVCPKIGLTATPIINTIKDVHILLTVLNPAKIKEEWINPLDANLSLLSEQLRIALRKVCNGRPSELSVDSFQTILNNNLMHLYWYRERLIQQFVERRTWNQLHDTQAAGQLPIKIERTIRVQPTEEQNRIQQIISRSAAGFFQKTHLITGLSLHPECLVNAGDQYKAICPAGGVRKRNIINLTTISKDQMAAVIKKIEGMLMSELIEFIQKSGVLKQLFLSEGTLEEPSLSSTVAAGKAGIVFVDHQAEASFIQAIAKKIYRLDVGSLPVVHSGVSNARQKQLIQRFKQHEGAGILFLLPESGGAGLNFPMVNFLVLIASVWTQEKQEQAVSRILRGVGKKFIYNVRTDFTEFIHREATIEMKGWISKLLLSDERISKESLSRSLEEIACFAESMMRSHCHDTVIPVARGQQILDAVAFKLEIPDAEKGFPSKWPDPAKKLVIALIYRMFGKDSMDVLKFQFINCSGDEAIRVYHEFESTDDCVYRGLVQELEENGPRACWEREFNQFISDIKEEITRNADPFIEEYNRRRQSIPSMNGYPASAAAAAASISSKEGEEDPDTGTAGSLAAAPDKRGGIVNPGNGCFLSSALQTIASIPALRDLFNDDADKLFSRAKEILEMIEQGKEVCSDTLQKFRNRCFIKKVCNGTDGEEDAWEVLVKLMNLCGYSLTAPVQVKCFDTPVVHLGYLDEPGKIQTEENRDPELSQILLERTLGSEVVVTPTLSSNNMQNLLKTYWEDEPLTELKVRVTGSEGQIIRRTFNRVIRKKELQIESLPDVLPIQVAQSVTGYRNITGATEIYPSGEVGIGPKYKLRAVLEHQNQNHYVAHVALSDGNVVTANDARVSEPREQGFEQIPGFVYFYVKDEEGGAALRSIAPTSAAAAAAAVAEVGTGRAKRPREESLGSGIVAEGAEAETGVLEPPRKRERNLLSVTRWSGSRQRDLKFYAISLGNNPRSVIEYGYSLVRMRRDPQKLLEKIEQGALTDEIFSHIQTDCIQGLTADNYEEYLRERNIVCNWYQFKNGSDTEIQFFDMTGYREQMQIKGMIEILKDKENYYLIFPKRDAVA